MRDPLCIQSSCLALLRNSQRIDGARGTIATQMSKLSRKLAAAFPRGYNMKWRLAGPDGILLRPEDVLDKAKWNALTLVAFVAYKPVPCQDMFVLSWKDQQIDIPVTEVHVRVTWPPKYDEMLETAKGMREQIASLFVRGPARGLHGGSARKNAGCAQKKPKGLKSGTCCGTGARVGVETRPAHEPTGGRVTTRKRCRGGASQEVWGDGVEGAAAARSSKASRSTKEIRGLAFAAAGNSGTRSTRI